MSRFMNKLLAPIAFVVAACGGEDGAAELQRDCERACDAQANDGCALPSECDCAANAARVEPTGCGDELSRVHVCIADAPDACDTPQCADEVQVAEDCAERFCDERPDDPFCDGPP
jgi:hypothetical protein